MKMFALALVVTLQAAAAPTAMQTISKEMMSQVDTPKQVVVRDAVEWATLWRQHAPQQQRPDVDLKTRTILAVFLGSRSSAGYTVSITGTRQQKGTLFVLWQEHGPAKDEIAAQVLTSPAHIVSIPRFDGDIKFEKIDP